ncbi:MAG: hypothetical protein Q4D02_02225 [Clostridia bacterium]|nr:hypothetical protein [Clostridia bacterium]
MLTAEKIEGLLKVQINCEEGRLLRLMSCDNSIKSIFVYHSFDSSIPCRFDLRVKTAISIFNDMVNYILQNEGNVDKSKIAEIDMNSILPTKEIIANAMIEIQNWYILLKEILEKCSLSELYERATKLSMMNYIILANFCGITDFCKNINNSRMLRRFSNFQNQTNQLSRGSIPLGAYLNEVQNHKEYIESMYKIYAEFELEEEDFLQFMLLFDIRKNKNILHKK